MTNPGIHTPLSDVERAGTIPPPCPRCGQPGQHRQHSGVRWQWACPTDTESRPPASDSHASVSPEQTPTPAADSAHRGDQCTVGETP